MPVSWLLLKQHFGGPANVALQSSENCQVAIDGGKNGNIQGLSITG